MPEIRELDARRLGSVIEDGSACGIVTSPPYAGTYDYADHQRLRFDFLALRHRELDDGEIGARRAWQGSNADPIAADRAWATALVDVEAARDHRRAPHRSPRRPRDRRLGRARPCPPRPRRSPRRPHRRPRRRRLGLPAPPDAQPRRARRLLHAPQSRAPRPAPPPLTLRDMRIVTLARGATVNARPGARFRCTTLPMMNRATGAALGGLLLLAACSSNSNKAAPDAAIDSHRRCDRRAAEADRRDARCRAGLRLLVRRQRRADGGQRDHRRDQRGCRAFVDQPYALDRQRRGIGSQPCNTNVATPVMQDHQTTDGSGDFTFVAQAVASGSNLDDFVEYLSTGSGSAEDRGTRVYPRSPSSPIKVMCRCS